MIGIDTLELRDVAKTIDHSLLRPELDLETVRGGVELALRYDVASATVRPADVAWAAELVAGSDVLDLDRRRLSAREPHDADEGFGDGGARRRRAPTRSTWS